MQADFNFALTQDLEQQNLDITNTWEIKFEIKDIA